MDASDLCQAPWAPHPASPHAGPCFPAYGAPLRPSVERAPAALEAREAAVLAELAREGDGHVTFSGLRRRLDLHPQVLTRTLRRMERAGLLARDEQGYRPTERGFDAAASAWTDEAPASSEAPREVLPVVQALLPAEVEPADVAARLSRRWFGGLRWYGEAHAPGETTLTWLTDDGLRVRVRVAGGTLALETEVAAPEAAGPGAAAPRLPALRALLAAISELYAADVPRAA